MRHPGWREQFRRGDRRTFVIVARKILDVCCGGHID
jgi:hypothetical protein